MSAPADTSITASPSAPGIPENRFQPYVPAAAHMPELTLSAVVLGTSLGLIFAASSLYLVLKVGMTVSASIPVAVLAITLFRGLSKAFGFRQATILENNIVQTSGSAGESIAFGVGVTMPALLMLGFEMDLARVMVVSILGGLLGILAMIPLRRAFIVKMHGRPGQPGTLLYPEGVAAAQVLISGEKGGTTGATVFVGFGIAFLHKWLTIGMGAVKETVAVPIGVINKAAVFAADMASELLGVGYIIGYRTSAVMMAGAVLGYLVIIPSIFFIGEHAPTAIPPSTTKAIKDMGISDIRNNYLLYIGAGCVAAAGLISMTRTLPMIVRSIQSGMASVRGGAGDGELSIERTENDMSMRVVILGSLGLLALLALFLMTEVGVVSAVLGALLVLLFGFLFVTVSSRLTGEIGSSSNPISGMTVATLMLTCLIFLALSMTSPRDRLLALSVAAVVCIAASNGGTTAQSLKTGFLVGGTPKAMQYAILVGALVSALVIGGTLLAFNAAGTIYSNDRVFLPKDPSGKVVVLNAEQRAKLTEKETYQGKEYLIWDTRREVFTREQNSPPDLIKVPEGTAPEGRFLVNPETGQVDFLKDPTISGIIKRKHKDTLTPDERTKLTEKQTYDGKTYLVWDTARFKFASSDPEGKVLVDPESGKVEWTETGSGSVEKYEDTENTRFDAPKTQVMRIIIDGVLTQKLNWSLVLIGAMIAVTMELCGVSSLAFAVGVYVPIQYSVPIFIGGIVRWGIDAWQAKQSAASVEAAGDDPEARARAEIEAIRKSETSPGVLLASGYIAGGSLAGVVVAFLEFAPSFKDRFNFSSATARLDNVKVLGPLSNADLVALGLFVPLIAFIVLVGMGKVFKPAAEEPAAPTM
ncbi:MAG: oligopeptide transporter, OPT family [Planctomycetia bacterium]|nr:oligopeptide transporter, OPT family [Planctomycetia bacterium]